MNKRSWLYEKDDGFSSLGMVLALLLSLSLLMSSAQVYKVQSLCSDVQDVADIAALAAEDVVASFSNSARVCDALLYTLTVCTYASSAIGLAALCIPQTSSFGLELIEFSQKILDIKNNFAQKSVEVLNETQKLLPFIAAVNASSVARENNSNIHSYQVCTFLNPGEGKAIEEISLPESEQSAFDSIEENKDNLEADSQHIENLAKDAQEHKEKAFLLDCGNNPNHCMYERVAALSSVSKEDNALYKSVDTWSFSVGLSRAQAYYQNRFSRENASAGSIREQGQAALRKLYYAYAANTLKRAYVHDSQDGIELFIPSIAYTSDQIKGTNLYSDALFPISDNGETVIAHAWNGCPGALDASKLVSLSELESMNLSTCVYCEFQASNLLQIAEMTGRTATGFEYHFLKYSQEAQSYQKIMDELNPVFSEFKESSNVLFENLGSALQDALSYRIEVEPPGKYGALVLVMDVRSITPDELFFSNFVAGKTSLDTRYAVSAASLMEDESSDGETVIANLVSNEMKNTSVFMQASSDLLNLWSQLIVLVSDNGVEKDIDSLLSNIPFQSVSGLATWAKQNIALFFESIGLKPPACKVLKPVLVRTGALANYGNDAVMKAYISIQKQASTGSLINMFSYGENGFLNAFQIFRQNDDMQSVQKQNLNIVDLQFIAQDVFDYVITLTLPSLNTHGKS